jgi:hypothetical protein
MRKPSKQVLISTLKIMLEEYRIRELELVQRLDDLGADGLEDPDYRELVALQTARGRVRGLVMWLETNETTKNKRQLRAR